MDKNVTPIHIRFHTDRPMENLTLSYLNKCRRFQAAFLSCAVREFAEKYQLFDLNEKELKAFIQAYLDYVERDNNRNTDTLRLQKSLQLIGTATVSSANMSQQTDFSPSYAPVGSESPSADVSMASAAPSAPSAPPVEGNIPVKEEKLIKDADRVTMKNVMDMFRGS